MSLAVGNAPVTSQQPSVGKSTPLAWKPVSPYPSGTNPRAGGAGASSRRPVIASLPGATRHQPNFMPTEPSLATYSGPALTTPSGHSPPTQSRPLP